MERFRKFSSETQKYVRQLSNHTHKDMNRRKALGVGGLSLLGLDHLAAVDGGERAAAGLDGRGERARQGAASWAPGSAASAKPLRR